MTATTRPLGATKLEETYTAGEAITAMNIVRLSNSTTVFKAIPDGTLSDASAIGIALSSAALGDPVTVRLFGILSDASFTFTLNVPVFLDSSSNVTDTLPAPVSGEYVTHMGKSLGTGAIFINIQPPEEID